jgi:hypothetical protein
MEQMPLPAIVNPECTARYNRYIDSGKKEDLKECNRYFEEYINEMKEEKLENPEFGKCIILNKKREDKYIHTYNVDNIIKKITDLSDKLPKGYCKNFLETFDVEPRTKCCNCISVVLYSNMNNFGFSKYLPNILISLQNIQTYLPNWILRLYLDRSVFELIYNIEHPDGPDGAKISCEKYNLGCEYRKMLNHIFNHANCEVYLSLCSNIYDDGFNMVSLRSQRYHGFIDPTVNINASRETDGFISVFDCHNLKRLETSDVICHMYPFNGYLGFNYLYAYDDNIEIDNKATKFVKKYRDIFTIGEQYAAEPNLIIANDPEYADWHTIYKKTKTSYDMYYDNNDKELLVNEYDIKILANNRNYYYETHTNIIPILAGFFSLKCKIKSDYFYDVVLKLKKFINVDFVELFGTSDAYVRNKISLSLFEYNYKRQHNLLQIGYDELLLMLLFEKIFDCEYIYDEKEEIVTLLNARSILELIGLSIPQNSCRTLGYDNSIDFQKEVESEPLCTRSRDTNRHLFIGPESAGDPDFYDALKLLCFDKLNKYITTEKFITTNKFIYPGKYFIYLLNNGVQYITPDNIENYKFFLKFYNVDGFDFDDDYYKKKYLKYKQKYLKLKQKHII